MGFSWETCQVDFEIHLEKEMYKNISIALWDIKHT